MLNRKKLRKTLRILGGKAPGLNARRLSGLAETLPSADARGLERVLRLCDAQKATDAEFRRLRKRSKMGFVARRIPMELRVETELPVDLVARTLAAIEEADWDLVEKARHTDHLTKLYRACYSHGAGSLERWWEVLTYLMDAEYRGADLYSAWRLRMESLVLRQQVSIPPDVRLVTDRTPKEIKANYPVPDCRYGPWIEREAGLYFAAVSSVSEVHGFEVSRAAWTKAHESLEESGTAYSDDDLIAEVARQAPLIESSLTHPTGPWSRMETMDGLEERRAIRRAEQWAADGARQGRDAAEDRGGATSKEQQSRRERTARNLLSTVASRESGRKTDSARLVRLVTEILSMPKRKKVPFLSPKHRVLESVQPHPAGRPLSVSYA